MTSTRQEMASIPNSFLCSAAMVNGAGCAGCRYGGGVFASGSSLRQSYARRLFLAHEMTVIVLRHRRCGVLLKDVANVVL